MFMESHSPVESLPLFESMDVLGAGMLSIMSEANADALAEIVRSYRFVKRDRTYGPRGVIQRMSACEEEDVPHDSPARLLSQELQRKWNEALTLWCGMYDEPYPFRTPLVFNDHLLLWYPEGDLGLGAHRDESKYKNMIVSITLCGQSLFNIHDNHDAPPHTSFHVGAGDAVFMAAPGFRGRDVRPYHSVTHVTDERIALILKQKEK